MKIRVGINGFGRIGKIVLRNILNYKNIEVVAINDLIAVDYLAYQLKHDSTHGILKKHISFKKGYLIIEDKKIKVSNEKDPQNIKWDESKVDYVIEATGLFLTKELAKKHLKPGVKNVVLSAPPKDETPMFVMGVNHHKYEKEMKIVSNASCTTNCLAPLMDVLDNRFGVTNALMTTIHAATATQNTVDGSSQKQWRSGRSAIQNIIPATTGAAKAVTKILPRLKGKITGMAFRVPTANVSVIDLSVNLNKNVSYEEVCLEIKKASASKKYKDIIGYSEEEVVSCDFNSDIRSSVFDKNAGLKIGDNFFKLISWYDNEWAYSNKIVELIKHIDRVNE